MTWFRGMERRGFNIHWIDATLLMEEKVQQILAFAPQIMLCKPAELERGTLDNE
jgi:hypothetical protein